MDFQEKDSRVTSLVEGSPVDHQKSLPTDISLLDVVSEEGEHSLEPKSDLRIAPPASDQRDSSDPQNDPSSVPRPTQDPPVQAASSSAAGRFQPKAQSRAAAMALSIAQSLWNMDSSKAGDTPSGPPGVLLSSDSCCSVEAGEPLGSARDAEWVNVDSSMSPQRDAASISMAEAASIAMAAAAMVDPSTRSSSGGGLAKILSEPRISPRDDKAAKEALIQE